MKRSASNNCECGHEKRDHMLPLMGTQGYGRCKVCLCDRYVKAQEPRLVSAAKASDPR